MELFYMLDMGSSTVIDRPEHRSWRHAALVICSTTALFAKDLGLGDFDGELTLYPN
jgi:hypothetical protein